MSLMRMDPFRDFDRLSQQMLRGTLSRPVALPMNAWHGEDEFVLEFDIPGVAHSAIDLNVEGNVLTVRAQRESRAPEDMEIVAEESPQGSFSRQVILSDNLDTGAVQANYEAGVLTVRIPVAEQAKPRRIEVTADDGPKEIDA